DGGVPTVPGDTDVFWHIRFSIVEGTEPGQVRRRLPREFDKMQSIPRDSALALARAVSSEVRDPIADREWWMIGEISELLLERLNGIRHNAPWPQVRDELRQFVHYLQNMSGLPDYESLFKRLRDEYIAL